MRRSILSSPTWRATATVLRFRTSDTGHRASRPPVSGAAGSRSAGGVKGALAPSVARATLDTAEHRDLMDARWARRPSLHLCPKRLNHQPLDRKLPSFGKGLRNQSHHADFAMLPSALLVSLFGLGACLGSSKWVLLSPNRCQVSLPVRRSQSPKLGCQADRFKALPEKSYCPVLPVFPPPIRISGVGRCRQSFLL